MTTMRDQQVDQILEGLAGDFKVGKRYYVFSVTYAYIGTVSKVTEFAVHLDSVEIVSRAGSESDAVANIVHGKRKPESSERVNSPLFVARQAIVTAIEMKA